MYFREIRRERWWRIRRLTKPNRTIPVVVVRCGFKWVFFENWATATHQLIGEGLGDGIYIAG
jgi:hypothetical protein